MPHKFDTLGRLIVTRWDNRRVRPSKVASMFFDGWSRSALAVKFDIEPDDVDACIGKAMKKTMGGEADEA